MQRYKAKDKHRQRKDGTDGSVGEFASFWPVHDAAVTIIISYYNYTMVVLV